MNILMVMTSHDQLGNTGRKTGIWLEKNVFCMHDKGEDIKSQIAVN